MASIDQAVADASARIVAARGRGTSLRIRGGGSKDFLWPAVQADTLETRGLAGILSYEPSELVVTVGAGTTLTELEAVLAEKGQYLAFEPPHFAWSQPGASPATVGGMVACGLSGPSRANVGAVRDYVLGLKLINGLGQHLTFGGQVMKNVAGYDVSRLMAGAFGTLGLITEVSLKVLPLAPAEATLVFELSQAAALAQLQRWSALPLPLNASCWVLDSAHPNSQAKELLFVRLRGAKAAVDAACLRMLADVHGHRMDSAQAATDWTLCRDQQLPFFQKPHAPDCVLWRLSVPQTAPVLDLPFAQLVEWHGGLRWLWAPLGAQAAIAAVALSAGGTAQVFMAPLGSTDSAPGFAAMQSPNNPAAARIAQRLKVSFDPDGIFNPGVSPYANHACA
ncbi:glycolate oxidase subunit GlcE [Rhodoferax sp.]|uniref:glycolate oxidase subunit GlcE n=1 Tax=Rhodoferax sp. TaxID=50421 RepID=UPI003782DE6A